MARMMKLMTRTVAPTVPPMMPPIGTLGFLDVEVAVWVGLVVELVGEVRDWRRQLVSAIRCSALMNDSCSARKSTTHIRGQLGTDRTWTYCRRLDCSPRWKK